MNIPHVIHTSDGRSEAVSVPKLVADGGRDSIIRYIGFSPESVSRVVKIS